MTSYRPIDSKREEFRKYLERTGVMDALTKVLVMLYELPDKPEDALDFMRQNLGDKRPAETELTAENENLRTELEDAHRTIKELDKQLQIAKAAAGQGNKVHSNSKKGNKDSSGEEEGQPHNKDNN